MSIILSDSSCITLIGMAGCGKSTVGCALAKRIDWALLDTDRLIEATYGDTLDNLLASRDMPSFLHLEEDTVSRLNVRRCVVATGGSVIYGPRAVAHLKTLGPLVYLRVSAPTILKRHANCPPKAFISLSGGDAAQVFAERAPLYEAAADLVLHADDLGPDDVAALCCERLNLR